MKNKHNDVDFLLKRAMQVTEQPDNRLIKKVKYELYREEPIMRKTTVARRSFSAVAALVAIMITATTAFAAWHFLKPSEVADRFENPALSAAFESETAVNINQSVTSGDYRFTLLAAVAGKDLTDMPYYNGNEIKNDRTYVVVAIENADNTPMPSTQDSAYSDIAFFASPLIGGIEPTMGNAANMNGGYTEITIDGVLYRIVECDNVEVFADRDLYFAISSGVFLDTNAFVYNNSTGVITANENYDGAVAVFSLPLDKSLADPEKAAQYLNDQEAQFNNDIDNTSDDFIGSANWGNATPIASTIKELTVGTNGEINFTYDFEYGSGTITVIFSDIFDNSNTAQSHIVTEMSNDDVEYAVCLSMDDNGVVTGAIVIPE